MLASFTVDVEQDCPPYLDTWRGMDEGLPALLDMLRDEDVRATFFTTGEAARRYPDRMRRIVADGHELGCHGDTHRSFAELSPGEARAEIGRASTSLRAFAPVASFRAPYLRLPPEYLKLLAAHGYVLDSSQGRHKHIGASVHRADGVLRVPASITSSSLRWPRAARNLLYSWLMARAHAPIVLFVHPWEFVDLRRERLRFDCRFKTGGQALDAVRDTLRVFRRHGATFAPIRHCAGD